VEREFDPHKLSNPSVFLVSMIIFLIIVGFLAAILYRQILSAFVTNPGLNGLILGVLLVGVLLALVQVVRLIPEVRWVNAFRQGDLDLDEGREPVLLAPMKALLGQGGNNIHMSTSSMRSILDSIGNRLDESRDISRYLIGLLVFLGLLGTFWGLLQTIGSIGDTIQSLDPNSGDANDVLDALKSGLKAPLDGMGTAFSSSLFGLAGSLVLGFLDLQAGRAQTRFYTELENWLSSVTDLRSDAVVSSGDAGADIRTHIAELKQSLQGQGTSERVSGSLASLVESIQQMVRHLRAEQEITRTQLTQQEEQQKELITLMDKMNTFFDKASKG
jgi:hypothetical protein